MFAALRVLCVLVLATFASAFLSRSIVRTSTRLNGEVYFDNNCPDNLRDKNSRCPGNAGYTPTTPPPKDEDKDFKAFQAAMIAKKKAAADALKKK